MTDQIHLAVIGAAGRMGSRIMELAYPRDDFAVSVAVVRPDADEEELGPQGVMSSTDMAYDISTCDVVIDFSSPAGFTAALERAVEYGRPFVSGTTGLSEEHHRQIDAASSSIAVLHAANYSVGVNLLEHLVELASGALDGWDAEVFEAHHRHKVDAPSGTALFLGRAAARGRNADLDDVATWSRHGHTGERSDDEIGFQVVRGGSIVGEHTVFFCGDGERVELTHRAQDRDIFALGALRAARWIVDQPSGRYSMKDVLFG
jgi:4-hydroxy-tetrahydrodipicolinate reductase